MTINLPMRWVAETRFPAAIANRLSVCGVHERFQDFAIGCKRLKPGFGKVVRQHKPSNQIRRN